MRPGQLRNTAAALALAMVLTACGSPEPESESTSAAETPSAQASSTAPADLTVAEFAVPSGSRPHDVAPAADGGVWFTGQGSGQLGYLDPTTGETEMIDLGDGSAPHGVITGPDGAAWVTDGGLNAIVKVDAGSRNVQRFDLPGGNANLNTATFDGNGVLWFTGQGGIYGKVDDGRVTTYPAPRGRGPYGITTTPDGVAWFSSLAGSYIARIDSSTGELKTYDVPSPGGGARRVWSDSSGKLWVTEWFAGKLARFDPATEEWKEWDLPGDDPQPYAVFVDEADAVWVTDFGANAIVRFDPQTEEFRSFPSTRPSANVRQLLGRPGEVWGAESGTSRLVRIGAGPPKAA
ncbi:MAG TPA: lyase [Actinomycetota bacterium]|nr:lyase [Actinomycetota bacterium]